MKGENPLANLFFKGRHLCITMFVALQSDKFLGSEFRKNIHMSYFTSAAEFATFFRKSLGGNAEDEKIAKAISTDSRFFHGAEAGEHAHRKVIFIGDDETNYYHVRAERHVDFLMCSPEVRAYCSAIAKRDGSHKPNRIFK